VIENFGKGLLRSYFKSRGSDILKQNILLMEIFYKRGGLETRFLHNLISERPLSKGGGVFPGAYPGCFLEGVFSNYDLFGIS